MVEIKIFFPAKKLYLVYLIFVIMWYTIGNFIVYNIVIYFIVIICLLLTSSTCIKTFIVKEMP